MLLLLMLPRLPVWPTFKNIRLQHICMATAHMQYPDKTLATYI
jgi:hypothetical protein